MSEWSWKNSVVLQEVEGKLATGVPQASGLGAPAVRSSGIELRAKKWTVMLVLSHFTARGQFTMHTPMPALTH